MFRKILASFGRRNVIIAGTAFLGISWAFWGYLEFVENSYVFCTVFITCRVFMGMGISATQTSSYAILTLLYPDEVSKAVAIIEGSVGIGLAIGPGFGSLFYHLFGFKGPFYTLSVLYFILILFIKPWISDEVETNPHNTIHISKSNIYEAADYYSPITYKKLLKNKKIVFAWMSAFNNLWQFTFIEPFFADYLFERYQFDPETCGMIFLWIGLGYAISCQAVAQIVPYFQLKRWLMTGLVCIGIATSFYGPSQILGFPGRIWISWLALFFAGLTSALSLLPVIPEMIEESKLDENIAPYLDNQPNRDVLNDHISGMYNTFFAIGNTLGPLLGNMMYVSFGCPNTCDFMAAYIIIFAGIYFLTWDDSIYGTKAKNEHMLDKTVLLRDISHFSFEKV